jgi:aspartate/methionine/tyrosine aminotransferase
MGIAKRAQAIKPSPTLATAAKAKAMKAQGIDVVDFGVGEPDFDAGVEARIRRSGGLHEESCRRHRRPQGRGRWVNRTTAAI